QDKSRRNGHLYSDKAPGVSFLALPAVGLYRVLASAPTLTGEVRAARFLASTVPALLVLAMILALLRAHVADVRIRVVFGVGLALGTLLTTLWILLFSHALPTTALVGVWM